MGEADDQYGPLHSEDSAQEVERDGGEAVVLEEGDEEAEADDNHAVHVLVH